MVGIVIVSHSNKIAEGIKDLSMQMAASVPMATAGGTADGRLGTDAEKIADAINEVYSEDGVLVVFDLGSAFMNSEIAIEFLDSDKQDKVKIVEVGLVEGTISAAVESSIGKNIEEIIESLEQLYLCKIS